MSATMDILTATVNLDRIIIDTTVNLSHIMIASYYILLSLSVIILTIDILMLTAIVGVIVAGNKIQTICYVSKEFIISMFLALIMLFTSTLFINVIILNSMSGKIDKIYGQL